MLLTIDVPDTTVVLSATIMVTEKDGSLTLTSRVFGVTNGILRDEDGKNEITLKPKEERNV